MSEADRSSARTTTSDASSVSDASSARTGKTAISGATSLSSARTQQDQSVASAKSNMAPTQKEAQPERPLEFGKEVTPKEMGKARPTGRKLTIMRHAERMDRVMPYWERPLAFGKEVKPKEMGKARPTGRKLTIMRHAERMDRVMPYWVKESFDERGKYRPFDLNQPLKLPERGGGELAFMIDPPLTEIGRMTSQMLGRGMRKHGVNITYVYCSPAWRCVETANELVKGLGIPAQVRIEPGLFEWMNWYRDSEPEWIDPSLFATWGYGVDLGYDPIIPAQNVLKEKSETLHQCYDRVSRVISIIIDQHTTGGADHVLIVAHGLTVDGGNRQLRAMNLDPPKDKDLKRMGLYYPYLALVQVEEMNNGNWRIVDNPLPPISHLDVSNRIEAKFYTR